MSIQEPGKFTKHLKVRRLIKGTDQGLVADKWGQTVSLRYMNMHSLSSHVAHDDHDVKALIQKVQPT
jgi:hypothetical protein